MAHSEACQLFIEQQIEEGLQDGKTPYSIGKDLAAWVEKLFEAKIPANTLRVRADRAKERLCTNVHSIPTPQNNTKIQKNQDLPQPHGGKRDGAGRPPKNMPGVNPFISRQDIPLMGSQALYFADLAILQLERIELDDPKRDQALSRVEDWIENKRSK